jgi:hypothetical protein
LGIEYAKSEREHLMPRGRKNISYGNNTGVNIGFEAKLGQTVNKLRSNKNGSLEPLLKRLRGEK